MFDGAVTDRRHHSRGGLTCGAAGTRGHMRVLVSTRWSPRARTVWRRDLERVYRSRQSTPSRAKGRSRRRRGHRTGPRWSPPSDPPPQARSISGGTGVCRRRQANARVDGSSRRGAYRSRRQRVHGRHGRRGRGGVPYRGTRSRNREYGRYAPSQMRDPAHRRRLGIRNTLWTLWLRRPARSAARRTGVVLSSAPADLITAAAVFETLCGLPRVLRERRVLPPRVEAGLVLLEDSQRRSTARR